MLSQCWSQLRQQSRLYMVQVRICFMENHSIRFCINNLQDNKTFICTQMTESLNKEIGERIHPEFSGVIQYLHNHRTDNSNVIAFDMPSKSNIHKFVLNTLERSTISDSNDIIENFCPSSSNNNPVMLIIN